MTEVGRTFQPIDVGRTLEDFQKKSLGKPDTQEFRLPMSGGTAKTLTVQAQGKLERLGKIFVSAEAASARQAAVDQLRSAMIAKHGDADLVNKVFKDQGITGRVTVGQFKTVDGAIESAGKAKRMEESWDRSLAAAGVGGAGHVAGAKEARFDSAEVARHAEGVSKDARLHAQLDAHHPGLGTKIKDKLTTAETYVKLVPGVGFGMSVAETHAGNVDHKRAKTLGDIGRAQGNPLLTALSDALSAEGSKKRNEGVISSVFSLAGTAASVVAPGVSEAAGAVVAHGGSSVATHVGSALAGKAAEKGVEEGTKKAMEKGTGVAAEAVEAHRRDVSGRDKAEIRLDTGVDKERNMFLRGVDHVRGGDFARMPDTVVRDANDARTARAMIEYLGPADQREVIRGNGKLSPDERTALVAAEESRLALKAMLGSPADDDLTSDRLVTKDESAEHRALADRGGDSFKRLQDTGPDRNYLKELWMAAGILREGESVGTRLRSAATGFDHLRSEI